MLSNRSLIGFSGVFRGRSASFGLTVIFWITFYIFLHYFVRLLSRLNHKICVPRLLVTVRVFCLLKTASKCTQTYHFRHLLKSYDTDRICQTSRKWSTTVHKSTTYNNPYKIHTKSNKCVSKMLTCHTGTAKPMYSTTTPFSRPTFTVTTAIYLLLVWPWPLWRSDRLDVVLLQICFTYLLWLSIYVQFCVLVYFRQVFFGVVKFRSVSPLVIFQ